MSAALSKGRKEVSLVRERESGDLWVLLGTA